nr:uncharacterized protein LOC113404595 [Vanessa tameamea]
MKPELMNNAPRGSWAECHESGWIQKDIFTSWFQKFIVFSRASRDNPVLLILDGHKSHTMNLNIIDIGRENGVQILATPPHCTHRLQPLDVGFMKPLSTYYSEAAQNWLRMNSGRVITQFQIAELVDKAFQKAATMTTAFNAFRATGMWPLNRDIFTEADFLSAAVTEITLPSSSIQNPQPSTSASSIQDSHSNESSPSILNASQIDYQPAMNPTPTKNADQATATESLVLNQSGKELPTADQIYYLPAMTSTPAKIAEDFNASKVAEPVVSNEYGTEPSTSIGTMAKELFSGFVFGLKDIMRFPKTKRLQELTLSEEKQKTHNFKAQNFQKEEKQKGTKSAKRVQVKKEIENKKNREERSENRQEISKKGKSGKKSDIKRSKTKKKDSSSDEDDAECLFWSALRI